MKLLDQKNWNRKEHFDFFSSFDNPFFGIVNTVDCTRAYQFSKDRNYSFFSCYLYATLGTVHQIESLRYRIDGDEICVFDTINASATIARPDQTFGFSNILYAADFHQFVLNIEAEVKRVQSTPGLGFSKGTERQDVIHFSALPWSGFTGLSHARNYRTTDSVPKITIGKFTAKGDVLEMPVSIEAHHGLVDGFHLAQFINLFQEKLNHLDTIIC